MAAAGTEIVSIGKCTAVSCNEFFSKKYKELRGVGVRHTAPPWFVLGERLERCCIAWKTRLPAARAGKRTAVGSRSFSCSQGRVSEHLRWPREQLQRGDEHRARGREPGTCPQAESWSSNCFNELTPEKEKFSRNTL